MAEARTEAVALLKRQVHASLKAARPSRSRKAGGMLGSSPAGDIVRDVAILRARSRDLCRNNAYAKAASVMRQRASALRRRSLQTGRSASGPITWFGWAGFAPNR